MQLPQQTFVPELARYIYLPMGFAQDIFTGIMVFFIVGLIGFIIKKILIDNNNKFKFVSDFFLYVVLLLIAAALMTHKKIFSILAVGLNHNIVTSFMQEKMATIAINSPYLGYGDWIFLAAPFLIFTIFKVLPYQFVLKLITHILMPFIFISMLGALTLNYIYNFEMNENRKIVILSNPIYYIFSNTWNSNFNYYARKKDLPSSQQLSSLQLIDPAFIDDKKLSRSLPKLPNTFKPNNVVVIVLESVAKEYVFNTTNNNKIPMPFLKKLSEQGLWFNNHYTTGNNSALAGFGLLSGNYSNPTPQHFEMREDIHIPSIATWLKKSHDSVFIISGNMKYFCAKGLIKNSFNSSYDLSLIPALRDKIRTHGYVSEPDGFEYFLSHLNSLKPPFITVYWSDAAHYPYKDYGSDYRVRSNTKVSLNLYLNNLNLLDNEIKKIYETLQKRKLLDDTLFIVIGDHGEGFGQHPSSWIHGTTLNEEQIKVPLLIYQSKIFKPQIINEITSSVDLLPTILNILDIQYDTKELQGNSLVSNNKMRKYIFVYGDEDELASIDQHKNKMIIDFSKGECKLYNLARDPRELNSQACNNQEQENALIKFHNYQPSILAWENSKVK